MKYECLKSARLEAGVLSGCGYALAPYEELMNGGLGFLFSIRGSTAISFVLGFRGVGHHYRCDLIPARNLVMLHLFKDGIPVYLQHASVDLGKSNDIQIKWHAESLRIFAGKCCFMNVLGDRIDSGRWGFSANGGKVLLPDVAAMPLSPFQPEWLILGDGYSNNRWPNRHIFSWPELTFGHRGEYLNACVAAGNTRRVLEVIENIASKIRGSEVIVAAGADDFIEGTDANESISRIQRILTRLKELEATRIHLCAIPPRGKGDDEVQIRNDGLRALSMTSADGFIDFHAMLSPDKESLLVNGDYPGDNAQAIMARGVLDHLGMDESLAPLQTVPRTPRLRGFPARVARKLETKIDAAFDRLPQVGVA